MLAKRSALEAIAPMVLTTITIIIIIIIIGCLDLLRAEQVSFRVPSSKRSEGRVTIEYFRNNETLTYQLAFSEVIDSDSLRSKISIGYVSYAPAVYHSRAGNMLTVDQQTGKCACLRQFGYKFVPELDWLVKLIYTRDELDKALSLEKAHHIGPTGIVLMLGRYTKFDRLETHRNVECQVTSARYNLTRASDVLFEVFVPSLKMFDSPKMSFFSVRQTVKNVLNDANERFSATMTIDYFYTQEIDKSNQHQLSGLEMDLNLPAGKGCSEFLEPTKPRTIAQSFIMTYVQSSSQSVTSLAYDHNSSYLRKEIVGRSVTIWDLNEDLLYHLDQTIDGKLYNRVDIGVSLEVCSVLSVDGRQSANSSGESADSTRTPASGESSAAAAAAAMVLPYEQAGSSVEVLEFLGAREIFYIGQTTVRELPCQLFEAILEEPPRVFDLELRVAPPRGQAGSTFEYIVQFYLIRTDQPSEPPGARATGKSGLESGGGGGAKIVIGDQFWPARISLLQRNKQTGQTILRDQLEVDDFHWGLYGWTKRPSELFMISECFDNEDEQLRLNLALDFDRMNVKENAKLLRHNKYKLEKDLLDDLFALLGISRMHLTEFQLSLGPLSVLANLVISDRIEDKRLSYFGAGDLPGPNAYVNNRIALTPGVSESGSGGADDETSCILLASHVSQVSMVVYCPRQSDSLAPTCTAIFGESQPVIKRPSAREEPPAGEDHPPSPPPCQVYRFEPGQPPKAATRDPDSIKRKLSEHKLHFETDGGPPGTSFEGVVRDYDVSRELQLIIINNYRFALNASQPAAAAAAEAPPASDAQQPTRSAAPPRANVRAYDSVSYNNLGDCSKMCNLDAACKSFSYCQDFATTTGPGGSSPNPRCVLSSLDLRKNRVENQLVTAKMSADNQIVVRDLELASKPYQASNHSSEFQLDLNSGCAIHERNFLSAYTRTEEILRLQVDVVRHFLITASASECARWVQSLEEQQAEHHSTVFAFCLNTNTCLADEDLFVSLESMGVKPDESSPGQRDEDATAPLATSSEDRELSCRIYRKRYQSYFNIAARVLKRPTSASAAGAQPIKQLELQFNTVEQCARACWTSFGHSCLSFDFCSPQSCLLNLLDAGAGVRMSRAQLAAKLEFETRTDCLHYERDLKWDQLRRDHLMGRHTPLSMEVGERDQSSLSSSSSGLLANLALFAVTGLLFIAGLAIGRVFNDRLENVAIGQRRGRPPTVGGGPSHYSNFLSGFGPSTSRSASRLSSSLNSSKLNIENEIYADPDAIRMDDFGQRRDINADELDKQDKQSAGAAEDNDDSEPAAAGASSNSSGQPGHIEVPNLISV